jgi:hypothetical protein
MSLTSLTPVEVEQSLGALGIVCRFTPEERTALDTRPVVDRPERLFGFPTPADNALLTLEQIKRCVGVDPRRQPAFFEHAWYKDEDFMRRRCEPGWHLLTMDVLSDSIQQPVNYLRSSRGAALELPSAVEVILMLFLHYVASGEQLLLKKHTWCSDKSSLHQHVTVGAFGRNGVFLSNHPLNFASQGLGICAKIPVF